MIERYDPNIDSGIHTIVVTIQQWEYTGHITKKIGGNCKGKDIIDFDFECEDGSLENDCNLKYDEKYGLFSATLKDSVGNTMDFEEDAEVFNDMIVGIEIVDFQRE